MSRTLPRWTRFGAVLPLFAALCALPAAAMSQTPVVVRTEPGTPVVALHLMIDAGPGYETPEQAGLAYLAVRSVIAPVQALLDSLGAYVEVSVEKDALSFGLIAAPDAWKEASRALLIALFRDPPDEAATNRQRQLILAELDAREVNPADALTSELDLSVFGDEHPWSRRAVGYRRTVKPLDVEAVDTFLRTYVLAERAVAAVVGPVDAAAATAHLRTFLPARNRFGAFATQPLPAASTVRVDYNSITTWVAAAYFFPATADVEALRLLTDLVTQSLAFGPRQRSVYDVRGEVFHRRGGGEVRVQIVVPPDEADAWADRLQTVVAEYAAAPLPAYQFAERLRHFRGKRLLELNSPEARARLLARERFVTGRIQPEPEPVERLTAERLHTAAAQLSAPTVVFLGPMETDG